ncbi:hypothetical protein TrRE_jg11744 [Triparma retinervis]|uniref:Uncharacterized protein n=1 Tax=Triparma retinervis TaxID=2557542 RepID=A0A9W7CLB3_9STRA|nr:hypothetical protein TrRE_jg11744 [Triparma retinervis]
MAEFIMGIRDVPDGKASLFNIPKKLIVKLGEFLRLNTQLYGLYAVKLFKELAKDEEFGVITHKRWQSLPRQFNEFLELLLEMCSHVEVDAEGNKVLRTYSMDDLLITFDPKKEGTSAFKACRADGSDTFLMTGTDDFCKALKLGGYKNANAKSKLAVVSLEENFPLKKLMRASFPGVGPVMLGGVDIHEEPDVKELLRTTNKGPGGTLWWGDALSGAYSMFLFENDRDEETKEHRLDMLGIAVVIERQHLSGLTKAFQALLHESCKAKDFGTWNCFMAASWSIHNTKKSAKGASKTGEATATLKADLVAVTENLAAAQLANAKLLRDSTDAGTQVSMLRGELRDANAETNSVRLLAEQDSRKGEVRLEGAQAKTADAYRRLSRNIAKQATMEQDHMSETNELRARLAESEAVALHWKRQYVSKSDNLDLIDTNASLRLEISKLRAKLRATASATTARTDSTLLTTPRTDAPDGTILAPAASAAPGDVCTPTPLLSLSDLAEGVLTPEGHEDRKLPETPPHGTKQSRSGQLGSGSTRPRKRRPHKRVTIWEDNLTVPSDGKGGGEWSESEDSDEVGYD